MTVFQLRAVITRCKRFSLNTLMIFESMTPWAHHEIELVLTYLKAFRQIAVRIDIGQGGRERRRVEERHVQLLAIRGGHLVGRDHSVEPARAVRTTTLSSKPSVSWIAPSIAERTLTADRSVVSNTARSRSAAQSAHRCSRDRSATAAAPPWRPACSYHVDAAQ